MSEKNILQSLYVRIWGSISVQIHAEKVTKVEEDNNNNNILMLHILTLAVHLALSSNLFHFTKFVLIGFWWLC
jgi:hypothetical protein